MPKQTDEMRQYVPGERAETGGVYRATHLQHRKPHELSVNAGEQFPPCRVCGVQVRYTLVSAATSAFVTAQLVGSRPAVLVADQERLGAHQILELLTREGYEVFTLSPAGLDKPPYKR